MLVGDNHKPLKPSHESSNINDVGGTLGTNAMMDTSTFASKFSHVNSTKDYFRKIKEHIPKDADYDVGLPIGSVLEVNERLKKPL